MSKRIITGTIRPGQRIQVRISYANGNMIDGHATVVKPYGTPTLLFDIYSKSYIKEIDQWLY